MQKLGTLGLALTVFLVSCGSLNRQSSNTAAPPPSTVTSSEVMVQSVPFSGPGGYVSWDDKLAEISRQYPAFGGYYADARTGEYVILTARSYKGKAINEREGTERGRKLGLIRQALEEFLLVNANLSQDEVKGLKFRFQEAENSFGGLQEWRQQLRRYLGEGITLLYIDDQGNKLVVGYPGENVAEEPGVIRVQDTALQAIEAQAKAKTTSILQALGIPGSAYTLQAARPTPTATITKNLNTSNFLPPLAGNRWDLAGNVKLCTIGANVSYDGAPGFLTAAHCTREIGNDPEPKQTAYMGATKIGVESYDPSAAFACFDNTATYRTRCRYADVAFMAYTVSSNRGRVVRTSEGADLTTTVFSDQTSTGSVNDPFYNVSSITPTVARPSPGTLLHNVGYVGGWKRATVTDNDTDTTYNDPIGNSTRNFTLLNAFLVSSAGVTSSGVATCRGDSGGPWYKPNTDGTVTMYGIQSGGDIITSTVRNGQDCYQIAIVTPIESITRSFPGTMLYGRP